MNAWFKFTRGTLVQIDFLITLDKIVHRVFQPTNLGPYVWNFGARDLNGKGIIWETTNGPIANLYRFTQTVLQVTMVLMLVACEQG